MLFHARAHQKKIRRKIMENKKVWRMRNKVLLIATLLLSGVVAGSVFLYVVNANGTKDMLVLDWVNGKIILDAEDREELTQEIISITLEDDEVKALTNSTMWL
jgi:hypothetical protein